jgi:hypothetical protein
MIPTELSTLSVSLEDIGERLRTQDNRFTADPIFLVQQRVRTYGIDIDYDPQIAWLYADDPNEVTPELAAKLEAQYQKDGEDEPEGYRRVGYAERWDYVQPFFTEAAADHFIATMAHRFRGPLRTYVDCAYRNWEWQAVRNHLMIVRPADTEAK